MRFKFDKKKSEQLRKNVKRGIGFEELKRSGVILTMRTTVRTSLISIE